MDRPCRRVPPPMTRTEPRATGDCRLRTDSDWTPGDSLSKSIRRVYGLGWRVLLGVGTGVFVFVGVNSGEFVRVGLGVRVAVDEGVAVEEGVEVEGGAHSIAAPTAAIGSAPSAIEKIFPSIPTPKVVLTLEGANSNLRISPGEQTSSRSKTYRTTALSAPNGTGSKLTQVRKNWLALRTSASFPVGSPFSNDELCVRMAPPRSPENETATA